VERTKKICREIQGGLADDRSNMIAYLAMMAVRLIEMRRILKRACSVYLHCDPTDGRLCWKDNLGAAGTRNGDSGKPWRRPAAPGMIDPLEVGRSPMLEQPKKGRKRIEGQTEMLLPIEGDDKMETPKRKGNRPIRVVDIGGNAAQIGLKRSPA
jgi:hypothetical protein